MNIIKQLLLIAILIILLSITECQTNKNCVDPDGNSVDWYMIHLLQARFKSYSYTDDNHKLKIYEMNKTNFPPMVSVQDLNTFDNNFAVWNDDNIRDSSSYSSQAHSKGIISFNSISGYIISHSVPKFPFLKEEKFSNDFPSTLGAYAQTFMCISMDVKNLGIYMDNVAKIRPGVQFYLSDNLKASEITKKLEFFVSESRKDKNPVNFEVKSLKGRSFQIFVKPDTLEVLPWDSDVPNFYKESFLVATWTRPAMLPNVCSKYSTINAINYSINGMAFRNTQDHSKWGVSNSVICIGDLNRTNSQLKRSGTAICLKDHHIAEAMIQIITNAPSNCASNVSLNKFSF